MDIWERSPAARGGHKRTDQSGRVFRVKQGDQGGESAWSDDGGQGAEYLLFRWM